jgi:hypothetical protein
MNARIARIVALAFVATSVLAQEKAVPVTVDNFARAETDMYMASNAKEGAFGKLQHSREPASIDKQTVIRMNRDTLYSFGVFDLAASPLTIEMPDAGKRFMSLMVVNEDHYVPGVYYGRGKHMLTTKDVGTRYVFLAIRTLVDPNDPADIKTVHALQDAIKITQKDTGKLELPNWDAVSQKKVRDALLVLGSTLQDYKGAFGTKAKVDPVKHLVGTATGWGGNPDKDASYANLTPADNDGKKVYRVTVKDVPVDGFWSISVYNEKGYFEKNTLNSYSVNNITGKKAADGSMVVQFGGCDGKVPNCIPIMKGWNAAVRLYRPRSEILNGKWKFPEPVAAS